MDRKDRQAPKVLMGRSDRWGLLGLAENEEEKVLLGRRASGGLTESLGHRDRPETLVNPGPQDFPEVPVQRETKELRGLKDRRVFRVHEVKFRL